ncbi:hypothetical protein [Bradyrhizobium sp. dw_411]|uniref:hypothetical protein n=1 Tax=Bradyrhizobium sp. dw_411 TaxID=2720082 RepID=UPI001BCF7484|nr:hypothetical protein [Bradyrhizobium sp. dw_411]
MDIETIRLRITGTKRLVMHNGRLADPLDPITKDLARLTSKRSKTEADHQEISRVEWFGGLWLHDGKPCIPAEALMATFVQAAKTRKKGEEAKVGLIVDHHAAVDYDGPTDLDKLWEDKKFRLRVGVKVRNARTMRTRPCFDHWSAEYTAHYFPSLFDRQLVVDLYKVAGFMKGLGDWRPQHGNFSVEIIE